MDVVNFSQWFHKYARENNGKVVLCTSRKLFISFFFLQKCQVFRDKGRSDTQRIKEGKGAKNYSGHK